MLTDLRNCFERCSTIKHFSCHRRVENDTVKVSWLLDEDCVLMPMLSVQLCHVLEFLAGACFLEPRLPP